MASEIDHRIESQVKVQLIPEYTKSPVFQAFVAQVEPYTNESIGYMFMTVDKEWYKPGDTVEGRIYVELFTHSYQSNLMLRLEGKEIFPKSLNNEVFEQLMSQDKRIAQASQRNSSMKIMMNELPIWRVAGDSNLSLHQLTSNGYSLDFQTENLIVQKSPLPLLDRHRDEGNNE